MKIRMITISNSYGDSMTLPDPEMKFSDCETEEEKMDYIKNFKLHRSD